MGVVGMGTREEWLSKTKAWKQRGLSTRAANCLVNEGILSNEDLAGVVNSSFTGWINILAIPHCGKGTTREILRYMCEWELIDPGVKLHISIFHPSYMPKSMNY